jgi:hypothetical protein
LRKARSDRNSLGFRLGLSRLAGLPRSGIADSTGLDNLRPDRSRCSKQRAAGKWGSIFERIDHGLLRSDIEYLKFDAPPAEELGHVGRMNVRYEAISLYPPQQGAG